MNESRPFSEGRLATVYRKALALFVVALSCLSATMQSGRAQNSNFANTEFQLLKSVASNEKTRKTSNLESSLAALARFYSESNRWDEYSAIRTRMSEVYIKENPKWRPPLPGGPYPRIGMPGYKIEKTAPRSILSRWLNPKNLPNCYREEESTFEEYEKQFEQALANALKTKDLPKTAEALEALAGLYCGQAKFAQGESLYLRVLEIQDKDPRLRRGEARTLQNLAMVYRIEAKDAAADKTEQKANSL
jgi:hypothetical protein